MINKSQKPRIHFSLDVLWRQEGKEPCLLTPGQAFPISTVQSSTVKKDKSAIVNGTVEMIAYTAKFKDDRVFTDVSTAPLSRRQIEREGLIDYAYTHSTDKGFGITVFDPDGEVPGCFSSRGRHIMPYSLRELFTREDMMEPCTGPACHTHLIPTIACKIYRQDHAREGDVELLDVETGDTAMFRRIPLPLILGSFDETISPSTKWQAELYKAASNPARARNMYLHTILDLLWDYKLSEKVFEPTRYYYTFPSIGPEPMLPLSKRKKIPTAILPPMKHDAWEAIDIGRKRLIGWDSLLLNPYRR